MESIKPELRRIARALELMFELAYYGKIEPEPEFHAPRCRECGAWAASERHKLYECDACGAVFP